MKRREQSCIMPWYSEGFGGLWEVSVKNSNRSFTSISWMKEPQGQSVSWGFLRGPLTRSQALIWALVGINVISSSPVPKQRHLWQSFPKWGWAHSPRLPSPAVPGQQQHSAWVIPFNTVNWLVNEPLVCRRLLSTIASVHRLGAAFYHAFLHIL